MESNLKKIVSCESKLNPKLHTIFRLNSPNILKISKKNLENNSKFYDIIKNTAINSLNVFNFSLGYVGYNEIIFYLKPISKEDDKNGSELIYNGRIQKMTSHLTSIISINYYKNFIGTINNYDNEMLPFFDCKVWQVGKWSEVLDYINERSTINNMIIPAMKIGTVIYLDKNNKQVIENYDSKNILSLVI